MAPVHKVAVIQWHIKAISYITSAASDGASVAILPEYHLCGWAPESPLFASIAAQYKTYLDSYCALAKKLKINIVPGTIIEAYQKSAKGNPSDDSSILLYNTAYFISSAGHVLGKYRKKNIWHPERPYLTSSGTDPHEVIQTNLGKVGLLICWDLAFPEAFRELIVKGAEIIIIPTYWGKLDASPAGLAINPDSEHLFLDTTLTSRCFENTCAIIFANATGPSDTFLGMSRVVLPFTGPVKSMGVEEGYIVADLDMSVLDVAEDNYKVRQDIRSEGWHYKHGHDQSIE